MQISTVEWGIKHEIATIEVVQHFTISMRKFGGEFSMIYAALRRFTWNFMDETTACASVRDVH